MAEQVRILIVDNELIAIRGAERVLASEGYAVEGAVGGREAISKIEKRGFDLVLTELNMPEVDGLSLVRWIKESSPSTGIVIITGSPSQESLKETLSLGIIDYVPKPFTPASLIQITRQAVEKLGREIPADEGSAEDFTPEMQAKLDSVIQEYRKKPGCLIPVLQHAQSIVGYLPPIVQKRIARGLNLSPAEIHSVVSFYSFFTMKPRGEHNIRVCLGTACYVKGIEGVLSKIQETLNVEVGDTTENRKFSLEGVRCLGACGLAPVMVVDQETYGAMTPKKAIEIIGQYDPALIEQEAAGETVEELAQTEG